MPPRSWSLVARPGKASNSNYAQGPCNVQREKNTLEIFLSPPSSALRALLAALSATQQGVAVLKRLYGDRFSTTFEAQLSSLRSSPKRVTGRHRSRGVSEECSKVPFTFAAASVIAERLAASKPVRSLHQLASCLQAAASIPACRHDAKPDPRRASKSKAAKPRKARMWPGGEQ